MKTLRIFKILCVGLVSILAVSCEKDLGEDVDILAGKWRNQSTLENETLLQEQPWKALDYIEYAPYNSVRAKRTVTEYTYSSDTEYSIDKSGTYTIKGDTLIRIDNSGSERFFKIVTINKNQFIYINSMGETTTYLRYKK